MFQLIEYPHPALSTPCSEVTEFDESLVTLLDAMHNAMASNRGIGIAANQLGASKRVILVTNQDDGAILECINPEIVSVSGNSVDQLEGCLSFPGIGISVNRPDSVTVKFFDREGTEKEIEASGYTATCFQHEVDHINGKTFIDEMSRMKRGMITRRIRKLAKKRTR
jgi:peptide deformylase